MWRACPLNMCCSRPQVRCQAEPLPTHWGPGEGQGDISAACLHAGAAFVRPEVRHGILPSILAALMAARATTRERLKATTQPAMRAVLDCRQRALKVTANALYGFTGAQVRAARADPVPAVPS